MFRVRTLLLAVAAALLLPVLYVAAAALGLLGSLESVGRATEQRIPAEVIAERARNRARAGTTLTVGSTKQVLFGDLHVHTTFSTDAFLWSLPMMNGEGAHPLADACDYARFCSALDFWSINDHAEASTPRKWRETRESIRQCQAVSGNLGMSTADASATDPDVAVFLGWEWTQVGRTPDDHWGHKNVIFSGLGDDEVPARTIGAAGLATDGLRGQSSGMPWVTPLLDFPNRHRYYNFLESMREVRAIPSCPEGVPSPELPEDCYESAATPRELFDKLDQWGFPSMVIPHGNTWGFYTPAGSTLDKQLSAAHDDPQRQFLFEIMSGHGNSEPYRDWRAVRLEEDGTPRCPEPTEDYLPSCWRAGQIIDERCRDAGLDEAECAERAAEARQRYVDGGNSGFNAVPGLEFEEWLDSGQCRDCFQPSFNYRPGGSGQYALTISNFDEPPPGRDARRFRFGFIASSDNHRARPGTGYKEFDRKGTTEANGLRDETWRRRVYGPTPGDPEPRSVAVTELDLSRGFAIWEAERQASFFTTGGLAAVHADTRSREDIWDALSRKEVYGTSGDRILLWFHLLNAPTADGGTRNVPMGGEASFARVSADGSSGAVPRFEVRAVGAYEQEPGCPAHSVSSLSPDRLERLCRGECYNPTDRRKRISRIEVIRIRPQARPDEPVASLIEDPWLRFECPPSPAGCVIQFEDPAFVAAGRDTVYYVRALQEPSPAVNAGNLRCERDAEGRCTAVRPCYGGYRGDGADDCTEPVEERAWSSPIFIDAGPPTAAVALE